MCGAFGKPRGTVARVHISQVIMAIHTKLQKQQHVIGALYGAKFKFPGRQKIHFSKWGSTKFPVDECENMVAEKPSRMAVESSRSLIVAFWANGALHSRKPGHCPLLTQAQQ